MPCWDVEGGGEVSDRVKAGFGSPGKVQPAVVQLVFHVGGGGGQAEEKTVCRTDRRQILALRFVEETCLRIVQETCWSAQVLIRIWAAFGATCLERSLPPVNRLHR